MEKLNIKISRIIKLLFLTISIIGIIAVIILSYVSEKHFDYRLFDLIFIPIELRTPLSHEKALGVETAKISSEEENKLYSMINESIKARLDYYSSEKEKELEKVRDLYLPEEFEKYKEDAKKGLRYFYDTRNEKQSYEKIEDMKFSKPRVYKSLEDRIGVINLVRFESEYINNIYQILIFKKINGRWVIEQEKEIDFRLDNAEYNLIQKIKMDSK
jgi:hypothetical protein